MPAPSSFKTETSSVHISRPKVKLLPGSGPTHSHPLWSLSSTLVCGLCLQSGFPHMVTRWLPAAPVQAQVERGNISPQNRNSKFFLSFWECLLRSSTLPRGKSSTNWLKPGILNRPLAKRHGVTLLGSDVSVCTVAAGNGVSFPCLT